MNRRVWPEKDFGYALVTVMLIINIMFVLTTSLGVITAHTRNNGARELHFTRALYAADAGIQKMLAVIMADTGGFAGQYAGLPDVPYGYYKNKYCGLNDYDFKPVIPETQLESNVTYRVGAAKMNHSGPGRMLLLNSVGQCKDGNGSLLARKTLRAEIIVFSAGEYLRGFSVFPEDPVELTINDNLIVDADFYINGNIEFSGSTGMERNVYASGAISGNCAGTKYPYYTYIPPFPGIEEDYYKSRASEIGQDYYGVCIPFENKKDPYKGFYYIDGDIDICGEYTGNAVIFTTGNINVTGDLIPENTGTDTLTLVCRGNINVKNYTVYANIVAGGQLKWGEPGNRENSEIHGAVCVTGIDFATGTGNYKMFYRSDMGPDDTALQTKVKVIDWREKHPIF